MADFAELSEIISRCMGLEDNKFLDAYYNNTGKKYCRRCEVYLYNEGAFCPSMVASNITILCTQRCRRVDIL